MRATAKRIVEYVELDQDDIEQRLRFKVWRALEAFDDKHARRLPEPRFVFSCVVNEKKDILNLRRRGDVALDEAIGGAGDHFEAHYLAAESADILAIEESDLCLPSTLTRVELDVIVRLYAHRYQTEITLELGLSKGEMERIMRSIREKLADWRPAAPLEPPLPAPSPVRMHQAA